MEHDLKQRHSVYGSATRFSAWVFAVVLALTLLAQGTRGLFETTEGRYGEAAREMLESGRYLTPTLDYNPHWTKPPLAYWMMAAGMSLFGQNPWGLRFFAAVASALIAALLARVAEEFWDRETALWAACIWTTGLLPIGGAHVVSTDIYLAAFETLAVAAFLLGWKGWRHGFVVMWAALGLAFLTKGPPALLPLLPIVVFAWRSGMSRRLLSPTGIGLFLVSGVGWYLVVIARNPGLLGYWIGEEVVGRMTSGKHHNADWTDVFTVYVPVMVFSLGLWGLVGGYTFLRRGDWRQLGRHWRRNSFGVFLLLWVVLPLVVFCASTSKLPLYLLPLCAPLTLAAARILRQTRTRRFLAIAGTASLLLMVGAKAGSAWVPHKNNMEQLAAVVGPVREQTGSNAAVLAFRQTRLFGLEFYLRDIICRVSDIPKASAYPVEISDFGACAGALDEASVIVLLKRDLDELLAAAARANVAFEQVDATPSWIVGVLSPTAPASDQ